MCNGGCKFQHYENHDKLCRKGVLEYELKSFLHLLYLGNFDQDGFFKKRGLTLS